MLDKHKKIHVMMLGLRGFPDVQGGVETHGEHLCVELKQLDVDVSVIVRSCYMRHFKADSWQGIRFYRLWSPQSKGMEAIVHTFLGVLFAAIKRPDILHIQAIGPSIMVPLARLLGLRVVMTHHGPDYDRQKWGGFAKTILKLGERFGVRYANKSIVISETIKQLVKDKHCVDAVKIPNGVNIPELSTSTSALDAFGIKANKYILMVTRLVPEKRHLDVIEAFVKSGLPDWKLVIVGQSDHPDAYTRQVVAEADKYPDVIMAGFQTGESLAEFYTHAGLFVLPSSHEGLPIALLEAMSYGLPVVASDIAPHVELQLAEENYFPLGNIEKLAQRFNEWAGRELSMNDKQQTRKWVAERYNWKEIAVSTRDVYRAILGYL